MVKKKKETMMGLAKETMGLGITSMAGHGVLGAMSSMPGMPSQASQTANVASAGLTLLNVGQLGRVGMSLPGMMTEQMNTKKKKSKDDRINRILG